jgi:hypothetical protein
MAMNHNTQPAGHFLLRIALATGLLAATCSAALAQTTNRFFEFVQAQSKRQYTQVPREVLALYYGWYGEPEGGWKRVNTNTHEIGNTARYPVKGPYNSHDPEIVDWQIDQAKAHGVTCFILSWFGTGPEAAYHERSMQLLIDRAERKNFKVSINWEQAPGDGRIRSKGPSSNSLTRLSGTERAKLF